MLLANLSVYSTASITYAKRDYEVKESESTNADKNIDAVDQVQGSDDLNKYNFGIMIDAGSTGR